MPDRDVKILIIDDQPGIRQLLSEILKEEGYLIYNAINGMDGISKIEEVKPDVILLDMKMPGMDGIEVLGELKQLHIKTKVIMMTAYGELDPINEARHLGAYGYVSKPFDVLNLCQTIRKVVAESMNEQLLIG